MYTSMNPCSGLSPTASQLSCAVSDQVCLMCNVFAPLPLPSQGRSHHAVQAVWDARAPIQPPPAVLLPVPARAAYVLLALLHQWAQAREAREGDWRPGEGSLVMVGQALHAWNRAHNKFTHIHGVFSNRRCTQSFSTLAFQASVSSVTNVLLFCCRALKPVPAVCLCGRGNANTGTLLLGRHCGCTSTARRCGAPPLPLLPLPPPDARRACDATATSCRALLVHSARCWSVASCVPRRTRACATQTHHTAHC